jgi:hypothetical protein
MAPAHTRAIIASVKEQIQHDRAGSLRRGCRDPRSEAPAVHHAVPSHAPTTGIECPGKRFKTCDQGKTSALKLEAQVLTYLSLLQGPEELYEVMLEQSHRLAGTPPQATRAGLSAAEAERKRERLTNLWTRGLLPDDEYERALLKLQAAQAEPQVPAPGFRVNESLLRALLFDIPRLIREATVEERRAIVQEVFERVWVKDKALNALTPTADAYPLLASVATLGGSDGVSEGFRTPNPLIHSQVLCH